MINIAELVSEYHTLHRRSVTMARNGEDISSEWPIKGQIYNPEYLQVTERAGMIRSLLEICEDLGFTGPDWRI
jgi:hypothetical protein